MIKVNYNKIFEDIYYKKITLDDKKKELLNKNFINNIKKELNTFDIINISNYLSTCNGKVDNRLKSYQKNDIIYILNYMNENGLSYRKVSKIFEISPSTLSKWDKLLKLKL